MLMISFLPFYEFQSTSSVWRTTPALLVKCVLYGISIHVLRVEDDLICPSDMSQVDISIHVLRVEDDRGRTALCQGHPGISIHVLRVEDDFERGVFDGRADFISIHVLRVEDDF